LLTGTVLKTKIIRENKNVIKTTGNTFKNEKIVKFYVMESAGAEYFWYAQTYLAQR